MSRILTLDKAEVGHDDIAHIVAAAHRCALDGGINVYEAALAILRDELAHASTALRRIVVYATAQRIFESELFAWDHSNGWMDEADEDEFCQWLSGSPARIGTFVRTALKDFGQESGIPTSRTRHFMPSDESAKERDIERANRRAAFLRLARETCLWKYGIDKPSTQAKFMSWINQALPAAFVTLATRSSRPDPAGDRGSENVGCRD